MFWSDFPGAVYFPDESLVLIDCSLHGETTRLVFETPLSGDVSSEISSNKRHVPRMKRWAFIHRIYTSSSIPTSPFTAMFRFAGMAVRYPDGWGIRGSQGLKP
jgi:hypothetical protein